jgi:hypothetical protein
MMMKSFIIKFSCFFIIPLVLLLGLYVISDPFKALKKFSLKSFSTVNREYLSTELYLKNQPIQTYNSFIFGSSRGCGLNTYQWKSYLPIGSNQFLFQAWGETITGIYQKISYLDKNNCALNNVIILLDVPGSFADKQESNTAMGLKHYLLSGKSKFYYQSILFYSFLKPTEIYQSAKDLFQKRTYDVGFDSISNDWIKNNKDTWKFRPKQNRSFDVTKFHSRPDKEVFSNKVIKTDFEDTLNKIKIIFVKHKTAYKIIITPDYNQLHINLEDMQLLKRIFGENNVYNYSGKNSITEDKYNFMDINHFDEIVGWQIIEDIYNPKK